MNITVIANCQDGFLYVNWIAVDLFPCFQQSIFRTNHHPSPLAVPCTQHNGNGVNLGKQFIQLILLHRFTMVAFHFERALFLWRCTSRASGCFTDQVLLPISTVAFVVWGEEEECESLVWDRDRTIAMSFLEDTIRGEEGSQSGLASSVAVYTWPRALVFWEFGLLCLPSDTRGRI